MRRHAAHLLATLLAFAAGCAASASVNLFSATRLPKADAPCPPAVTSAPAFRFADLPTVTPAATAEPAATPRVTQEVAVTFPRLGKVLVRAVENFGEPVRVEFVKFETDERLTTFPVVWPGDEESFKPSPDVKFTNPFLRFEVLRVAGLPQPLILAVAVTPGGSGHGFCAVLIGEVGGRLKLLTPKPLTTSNIGGVFVGDLGRGRGFGVAVWNYIWDFGSEGHYSAHQYEIQQYTFDRRRQRFKRGAELRSRRKYGGHGEGALAELGLNYVNLLQDIPEVSVFNQP